MHHHQLILSRHTYLCQSVQKAEDAPRTKARWAVDWRILRSLARSREMFRLVLNIASGAVVRQICGDSCLFRLRDLNAYLTLSCLILNDWQQH